MDCNRCHAVKLLAMSTNFLKDATKSMMNLVIMITLPVTATRAQNPFLRIIGGSRSEYQHGMIRSHDGGLIMAGSTESYGQGNFGLTDDYVVKTDSQGNVIWSRSFNLQAYDDIYWIEPVNDSGYVICGIASDNNSSIGLLVARISENGEILWQKILAEDEAGIGYCIRQTSDGGFIIAGEIIVQDNLDFLLIKTDCDGNIQWSKQLGSSDPDIPNFVMQTHDGGYFVCGVTRQNSATIPVYAVKTDSLGDVEWQKTYLTSPPFSRATATRAIATKDGGYLIGGSCTHGELFSDIMLLRIDSNGSVEWTTAYGGNDNEYCEDMIQDGDGNLVICGSTASFANSGYADALVMRMDSSGVLLKASVFGKAIADDDFASVVPLADGSYLLSGTTSSYESLAMSDWMLMHVDHNLKGPVCDTVEPNMMQLFFSLFENTDVEETDVTIAVSDVTASIDSGATDSLICDFATVGDPPQIAEEEFSIFPNPSDADFYIRFNLVNDSSTPTIIRIVNEKSQVAATIDLKNAPRQTEMKITIPVSVPAGVYLVQAISKDKIITRKLILSR